MSEVNFYLGSLQKQIDMTSAGFQSAKAIQRLWQKDYSIWRTEDVHKKSILNRLGWLHSVDLMLKNVPELQAFGEEIRSTGFKHAVVLGMGGSSLCPDVCRSTFGSAKGYPELLVLDSTDPVSVDRIMKSIQPEKALFLVASKSGGTTETNMFYKYFHDKVVQSKGSKAGDNFVAITDANTQMEKEAKEKSFRKIFLNPEDIGGRYSALSYFGLVPMSVTGMDIKRILQSASAMMSASSSQELKANSAAMIGIAMGEAYKAGMDKLTFAASKKIETFGYWTEQLIAESTGKEGKGIVPIEGEPPQKKYSHDRLFVFLTLKNDRSTSQLMQKKLGEEGHPYIEIILDDPYELGGEFFRWEFATAVAAVVMNINPFDEPNVKESKDNTVRVIEEFKKTGSLPKQKTLVEEGGLTLFCEESYAAKLKKYSTDSSFKGVFRSHLRQCSSGDYAALLAYVDQNETNINLLQSLRGEVGELTGCATTLGFGPRYLHSTGQLHKGGKHNGVFTLITANEPLDRKIPGEQFSFEVLKNAQAAGDYQSLSSRSLRLVHIHLGDNVRDGLKQLLILLRAV